MKMTENNEDFLFAFSNKVITTKKFCFKKKEAAAGSASTAAALSPFFKSDKSDSQKGVVEVQSKERSSPKPNLSKLDVGGSGKKSKLALYGNKKSSQASLEKTEEVKSVVDLTNENSSDNLDMLIDDLKNCSGEGLDTVKASPEVEASQQSTDSLPSFVKKFSFKKKKLSLDSKPVKKKQDDKEKVNNSLESKSLSNFSDADFMDDEEFERTQLYFDQEENNSSEIVKPKKFSFRNPLSSSSSSSLQDKTSQNELKKPEETTFCDADYMDDEEFERQFGSQSSVTESDLNLTNTDWNKDLKKTDKIEDDDLDVSDVNWSEDVFKEIDLPQFHNRQDDSEEFQGTYPHTEVMLDVLHQKFGLINFRPHQKEIINASLTQHDIFVLMPTGGGKSLCYQLPAILMPGVTIVISPLRALISDQVDKLNALDIPSAHLCADVSKSDYEQILLKLNVREPLIKLLYLTPEKIAASKNIMDVLVSLYQRDKFSRIVIDEAHCLSQWGHDFRPDYKQLSMLRKRFPKVPIICLTATATREVQIDVTKTLGLRNVKTFIRSFNRPNIKYQVLPKGKTIVEDIANLIKAKFYKKSGIVYCLSRGDCEKLSFALSKEGVKARAYHAGLSDKLREKQQREWMQDQFHVIVATIAFGMGIDKPDVRFVIHNSIPKSVEAFYQESGRAGRDGEVSYSYLFYTYGDVARLKKIMMMERSNQKALEGHFENLNQMVAFAENVVDCRRYLQLLHLGETFDRSICIANKDTTCDNCSNVNKYKMIEVTEHARNLGILVNELASRGNVTMLHVTDVYKGSATSKITKSGHNSHRFYGKGSQLEKNDIIKIIKDLLLKNIFNDFCTYTGGFPVVYIKPGPKFSTLKNLNNYSIPVNSRRPYERLPVNTSSQNDSFDSSLPSSSKPVSKTSDSSRSKTVSKFTLSKIQVQCHEELLEECRRLALERNVTLSSIMNLSAIKTMSDDLPNSEAEFLKIQHVTKANYAKFGQFFLAITSKFRKQMDELKMHCSEAVEEEEFKEIKSQAGGVKRKFNGYGGYKRSFKKAKTKRKSSPKKGKAKNQKTKGGGSGLGLMPVHFK